ncbi:hypothetical protein IFM89_014441 [Coptis chinensis]|uniref:Uncharacterized protein n=1 Tax=Coptis chinensis TaxID=261450 RepID=A0A835LY33_9MAGN|nr:hypothetical protein IFM89_014441 [Coptis chinensis]
MDIHLPHVKTTVNNYIMDHFRDHRCALHKYYVSIPNNVNKLQHPFNGVSQESWERWCDLWEIDKFKDVSTHNQYSRSYLVVNHFVGSKSFVQIRADMYPVVDIVEDENIEDRGLGLENLVDACYGVHEGVRGDVYGGDTDQISDFEQPFVPEPDLDKKYVEYKSKAEEKLYLSCEGPVTTLSAVVELHELKKQYDLIEPRLNQAITILEDLLKPVDESLDHYKKQQLRELAMINGTLREESPSMSPNMSPFNTAGMKRAKTGL